MNDGYYITINLKSNLDECFQYFEGDNYYDWTEDFIENLSSQMRDTLIKYKNFNIDVDMEKHNDSIAWIRLWDDNFTEWRDDSKWNQYIQECNREKESLINVINSDIIDVMNTACTNMVISKFPKQEFLYNNHKQRFYVEFYPNSRDNNDILQLKFDYVDDIDFEDF